LWTVRSGARWIDVPERYGRWNSVYRRFRRWAQIGLFEALIEPLAGALAEERIQMITPPLFALTPKRLGQ
jgi:transposase